MFLRPHSWTKVSTVLDLFVGSKNWSFNFIVFISSLSYAYLLIFSADLFYFLQVSSIIFVDLPVSTGFTYATTKSATQRSDSTLVLQVHQFLRKVLTIFLFLVLFHNYHLFLWFLLFIDKYLVNRVCMIMFNFLQWLIDHPKFLTNEVYIGGDSYSGIPVPAVVQEISRGEKLVCFNVYRKTVTANLY